MKYLKHKESLQTEKETISMNKNIPYYLIAIGIFVLLKFWIGSLENDHMIFLLKPTDKVFSIVASSESVYSAEDGFYHQKLNILIDKSCSGYNFLLLNFLMLYFLFLQYAKQNKHKILGLFGSMSIAYVFTIGINSARILVAATLQQKAVDFLNLEPKIVHESLGVIIYLSFLLIIYIVVENILKKKYAKLT